MSATTDLWKCNYNNNSYINLVLFYIDIKTYNIKHLLISTKIFEEKKNQLIFIIN